jgi:hypothetical protein
MSGQNLIELIEFNKIYIFIQFSLKPYVSDHSFYRLT